MSENFQIFIPRTRRAFGVGVGIALSVLAITVFAGLLYVRAEVRGQIIRRDAEALYATTLMEQLDLAPADGVEIRTEEQIGFDAAVRASRLRGVLGIRFYDAAGRFRDTFPGTILPQPLDAEARRAAQRLEPHGQFVPEARMSDVFIYRPEFSSGKIVQLPLLLVTVPLHQREAQEAAGVAQFIIEGASVAGEYARLDRRLGGMALLTFLVAGVLLTAMLWPAFQRVENLTHELAQRGLRLQRANEELALAARVSAVGAVSAHLLHGLRNPLASLSQFVARADAAGPETDPLERADALTAARRMQVLMEHTLEVLGDTRGEPTYELTVSELGDDVMKRVNETAARRQVEVTFRAEGNCTLSSRTANLAGLILVNLLENAIQATPSGGRVLLAVSRCDGQIRFRVMDEGPGIPGERLERLFLPGRSTREGGSGIGLAISRQIADHLGAELALETTSANGSVFRLCLPLQACEEPLPDSQRAPAPATGNGRPGEGARPKNKPRTGSVKPQ